MRNYDPVFHPILAEERVYFGSSSNDSVYCLDASSGEVLWVFTARGPVRISPTYAEKKIYFGADDGFVYCLDAATGSLHWKYNPTEESRLVIHDGRMISFWPIRTGVLVDNGIAYFAASMFPWKSSYLCAIDAESGEIGKPGTYLRELGTGWTLEGALLLSNESVIIPQGRVAPLIFQRSDGHSLGTLEGGGGSFVLLTEDRHILHGPGNKAGWITDSRAGTKEKVASYERGNAIVVDQQTAFMLSDHSLAAMQRESKQLLWSQRTETPFSLIFVDKHLYSGGDGVVTARRATDGQLVWAAQVSGKAYGLAAVDGMLIASTDDGSLYTFDEGERQKLDLAQFQPRQKKSAALRTLPPVSESTDRGLLDRWVFQQNAQVSKQLEANDPRVTPFVANQVGKGLAARPLGPLEFVQAGSQHAYLLDGLSNDLEVAADFRDARVPQKEITVEAWVRVDEPLEWGGIIGMAQDNGEYERGWMLGYRQNKFGFAIAAEEGNNRLTWILCKDDYIRRNWYHVAGTYDGRNQKLYVNGKLVNSATVQKGVIRYPERAFYQIGAYRDDDEYFRMTGQLHEIRVYGRVCSAVQIAKRYADKRKTFPEAEAPVVENADLALVEGPILRFTDPHTALVSIELPAKQSATLILTDEAGGERSIESRRRQPIHEFPLQGLRKNRLYTYRIFSETASGDRKATAEYECDTHFNFELGDAVMAGPSTSAGIVRSFVADLSASSQSRRGLGVLFVREQFDFVDALLQQTSLRWLILYEEGNEQASVWERRWVEAGLNGTVVALLPYRDAQKLPLPGQFANVVMDLESSDAIASAEVLRITRPFGGLAYLNSSVPATDGFHSDFEVSKFESPDGSWWRVKRGPLKGAGVWSHMYGSADNSGFGGEQLSGARSTTDLEVQWAGRPGPRHQSDRQNRKPAPLATAGRLFVQGFGRVIAMDAFNGSILWNQELPRLRRFNMPRDAANWCADDQHLYLAMDHRVHVIHAATGDLNWKEPVPAGPRKDFDYAWGYIAQEGDLLFGTAVKSDSFFQEFWGKDKWYDALTGESTHKVCSDNLFALNKKNKSRKWKYEEGLILNPTLTLAEGIFYFLESRNPELLAAGERRIGDPKLWKDLYMVALDSQSGKRLWQRQAQPMPGTIACYLAYSDDRLVLQTSSQGHFAVYVFDAQDGSSQWRKKFAWEVDHHGKHLSRLAISGGRIYIRPLVFDLKSGAEIKQPFPEGHQCGMYTTSAHALFLRAGELAVWDQESGKSSKWNRLRPDCWISTIPANGMLLSPEGGGGCSCGSWMETSLGFMPSVVR